MLEKPFLMILSRATSSLANVFVPQMTILGQQSLLLFCSVHGYRAIIPPTFSLSDSTTEVGNLDYFRDPGPLTCVGERISVDASVG